MTFLRTLNRWLPRLFIFFVDYILSIHTFLALSKNIGSALLIPHIYYAIEVVPGTSSGSFSKVQELVYSVIRYVYGLHRNGHISHHAFQFLGFPFKDVVDIRILSVFFKKYSICNYLRYLVLFLQMTTVRYELAFVVRVARTWNNFPFTLRIIFQMVINSKVDQGWFLLFRHKGF